MAYLANGRKANQCDSCVPRFLHVKASAGTTRLCWGLEQLRAILCKLGFQETKMILGRLLGHDTRVWLSDMKRYEGTKQAEKDSPCSSALYCIDFIRMPRLWERAESMLTDSWPSPLLHIICLIQQERTWSGNDGRADPLSL